MKKVLFSFFLLITSFSFISSVSALEEIKNFGEYSFKTETVSKADYVVEELSKEDFYFSVYLYPTSSDYISVIISQDKLDLYVVGSKRIPYLQLNNSSETNYYKVFTYYGYNDEDVSVFVENCKTSSFTRKGNPQIPFGTNMPFILYDSNYDLNYMGVEYGDDFVYNGKKIKPGSVITSYSDYKKYSWIIESTKGIDIVVCFTIVTAFISIVILVIVIYKGSRFYFSRIKRL